MELRAPTRATNVMRMQSTKSPGPMLDGLDAIQQQMERLRLALDAYTDQALEYVTDEEGRAGNVPGQVPDTGHDLHEERLALESQRLRLAAERAELERQRADLCAARQDLTQRQSQAAAVRHERLDRLKELLKEEALAMRRQAEALETQRRYAREVLDQRADVMELQRLLADAEQRMIRRWGIHQAFGWSFRAMLCLGILVTISYFAGAQLAEQVWMASAAVRHLGSETPASEQWVREQRETLTAPEVLHRASHQLRQSGYGGPSHPEDLGAVLAAGLKVWAPMPNIVHLELHGADPQSLAPVLNAVVRAYASLGTQPEGAGRSEFLPRMHIVQEARTSPVPVSDNRRSLTATLFAASLGIMMLVVALFAILAVRRHRGEVAALDVPTVTNGDAWKAYHDALERPTGVEAQPLF
jgi:hypothetical protein